MDERACAHFLSVLAYLNFSGRAGLFFSNVCTHYVLSLYFSAYYSKIYFFLLFQLTGLIDKLECPVLTFVKKNKENDYVTLYLDVLLMVMDSLFKEQSKEKYDFIYVIPYKPYNEVIFFWLI